jgi:hypothetical protein
MQPSIKRPTESDTPSDGAPPPSRWQFGIASMLWTMGLVSVLAAAFSGLLDPRKSQYPRGFFVVMTIAAPVAVMILFSLYHAVSQWLRRR